MTEYFWLIWFISVMAASCIIPIQYRTLKRQIHIQTMLHRTNKVPPISVMVAISTVQTYVLLAIATYVGLWLMPSTGLRLWMLDYWQTGTTIPFSMQEFWMVSLFSGAALGGIVKLVDRYYYQPKLLQHKQEEPISSRFLGFLSSFYGGICEEVLMRLGFMTLVVYLMQLIGMQATSYWLGIIASALLFAVAHLPSNIMIYGKSGIVIQWTMLLNGILGIQFGWLYWQYGLEAAIVSHFSADIILHVIAKKKT